MVTLAVDVLTPPDFMDVALALAARGRGRTSPNPMVGAVVVSAGGVVVGSGFHERAGEAHAEIRALEMAGSQAKGATLYCTLEPCSHTGRTGPCVERIVGAGVAHVVASMVDPNPLVAGQGFAYLKAHGVGVEIGLRAEEAAKLNQPFLTLMREGRPFVVLKAAVSADGCIAEAPGRRTQLTSDAANQHAHRVRAEVDAIGVGVGTILIDDPLLTARGVSRDRPLVRVIFDRTMRMPAGSRVLSTVGAGPVIIVTTERGAERRSAVEQLQDAGASVEVAADDSLCAALKCLGGSKTTTLLLEGGARVHAAAWREGVSDFVRLYVAPRLIGPGGLGFLEGCAFDSRTLVDRRIEPLGPDVLVEGYVHRPR